ncbi:origin recognition complex, subunit 6 [Stachybotrys elegans]|uniref:Origin recognition complex, subunit 6 n=1 Tax=Stachybotrys elegans TaxID=80388 RepID=A0A8K0WS10_9HYPO|nr:origin recognition complex, subunit 6 [Stachybotrys elegans]
MSRQIEQALLSLMPTYGSDLPPSLVELAESLLAQSRHRASTLKPEEEIARLYACANIACDRLKISLDLPPIEPRPPIPPRIYKRLYSHLENSLSGSSTPGRTTPRQTRTPSKRTRTGGSPDSERPTPSRPTPTKEQSLAPFRTPSKTDKDASSRLRKTTNSSADLPPNELQPWIRPTIRYMCAETSQQKLGPSVLAGMESILIPGGKRTEDEWVKEHTTDLIAAIYFFTTMRVRAIASGEGMDRDEYVPQRKAILALLAQARMEVTVAGYDEDEAWRDWTTLKAKEFDAAVAQVNERDWLQGDWYKGIDDVVQGVQDSDMLDADVADSSQIPIRRADTMLQDKYDLLSDTRRADYKAWKESMLSRIATAMTTAPGQMDTH